MSDDARLFVSHVSEDRVIALEIVAELERRGLKCWIAPRDVTPGKFDDVIADAIDHCRAFLLIFSEKCNTNDYISREVTCAGEAGKLIIPIRIEDAVPKRGLGIRLANLHRIDAFPKRELAINEILAWLGAGSTPSQEVTPHETVTVPQGNGRMRQLKTWLATRSELIRSRPRRASVLLGGAVVVALALWFGPGLFSTPVDRTKYDIRVHTNLPNASTDHVRQALTQAGYSVAGVDNEVDQPPNSPPLAGVDYARGTSDKATAEELAALIKKTLGIDIVARPQQTMTKNKIGVWLPSNGDYAVEITFAGFDRQKDIVPLGQKLRDKGWQVQGPRAERNPDAAGVREVRYFGKGNLRAAERLAKDVVEAGAVPAIKPVLTPGEPVRSLQLWISQ